MQKADLRWQDLQLGDKSEDIQPVSPGTLLQKFVPSLSLHQQETLQSQTKTYSFKSRGRGQMKTWGDCSVNWVTPTKRRQDRRTESDGDKQESKVYCLWNMVRSPSRETDISNITTSSNLNVLVEGFLVLVFQGFGFFLVLKTQQWIPLGIPDSPQLCWPPHAFPFLAPGLKMSTPSVSPSPKLCSSLQLVQEGSLPGSTTQGIAGQPFIRRSREEQSF